MRPIYEVSIDLETGPSPQEEVDALMKHWKPPGNVKDPAKIEARREEAYLKAYEKSSLLNAAPILCVGLAWLNEEGGAEWTVFESMEEGFSEKRMLQDLSAWISQCCAPALTVIGHNIIGFDLPKLRLAYLRHRLPRPNFLRVEQAGYRTHQVFDLMRNFRYISTEHSDERFVSAATVCRTLGINQDEDEISGADVAQALNEGRHDDIMMHCRADAMRAMTAFHLITAGAMPVPDGGGEDEDPETLFPTFGEGISEKIGGTD